MELNRVKEEILVRDALRSTKRAVQLVEVPRVEIELSEKVHEKMQELKLF